MSKLAIIGDALSWLQTARRAAPQPFGRQPLFLVTRFLHFTRNATRRVPQLSAILLHRGQAGEIAKNQLPYVCILWTQTETSPLISSQQGQWPACVAFQENNCFISVGVRRLWRGLRFNVS